MTYQELADLCYNITFKNLPTVKDSYEYDKVSTKIAKEITEALKNVDSVTDSIHTTYKIDMIEEDSKTVCGNKVIIEDGVYKIFNDDIFMFSSPVDATICVTRL